MYTPPPFAFLYANSLCTYLLPLLQRIAFDSISSAYYFLVSCFRMHLRGINKIWTPEYFLLHVCGTLSFYAVTHIFFLFFFSLLFFRAVLSFICLASFFLFLSIFRFHLNYHASCSKRCSRRLRATCQVIDLEAGNGYILDISKDGRFQGA